MSIQFQKPDYIIVFVSDMQRSTAFYRDTLGLPLKFTSPGWTEFSNGGTLISLHKHMGGEAGPAQPAAAPAPLVVFSRVFPTRPPALKTSDVPFLLLHHNRPL